MGKEDWQESGEIELSEENIVEIVGNLHKPIDERRRELLVRRNLGVPFKDIVEYLSVKYQVSENAIYEDWRRRKKWAGKLVEIDDSDQLLIDQKVFLDWLKREAVTMILDRETNDNAKIGAIRSAREILHDQYEIAKDTGKIRIVPSEVKVISDDNRNTINEYLALFPCEAVPREDSAGEPIYPQPPPPRDGKDRADNKTGQVPPPPTT